MSNITRDKKGKFVKGHGWDQEVLDKMIKSKTQYPTLEFTCTNCNKIFYFRINKHHTKRKFCSIKCKYTYGTRTGIALSKKSREKLSKKYMGEGNPGWKGGLSLLRTRAIYTGRKYRKWRNDIFLRDNYTCQQCKKRGDKLNADHIIPWAEYKKGWFDISNGQTLCELCHAKKTWGENSRGVGRIQETQFKKGHKGYWTEERKKNRKPHSGDFKKGHIPWNAPKSCWN